MRREIIKEIKVGFRSGKFLILLAGLVFYGLLTPVMLTAILPKVLASQFPGEDVSLLLNAMGTNQQSIMASFLGDIYEIGTLLITFVLCGLLAQEIKSNTLVLPLCAGSRYHEIIGAKVLVYGGFLLTASVLALGGDYVYAGILSNFQVGMKAMMISGMLMGLYGTYLVANVMMWGALVKNPIAAGFLTLGLTFGTQFVAGLFQKDNWVPAGLMSEAAKFNVGISVELAATIATTILIIGLMLAITRVSLGRMEWNGR